MLALAKGGNPQAPGRRRARAAALTVSDVGQGRYLLEREMLPGCPLCRESGVLPWATIRDHQKATAETFTVVRCAACGLIFLNPRPCGAALQRLYGPDYGPYTADARENLEVFNSGRTMFDRWKNRVKRDVFSCVLGYPSPDRLSAGRRLAARLFSRRVLLVHYRLPRWVPGGRVLEIGCGPGYFLNVLRELGWQPTGLEWDAAFARRVSGETGIPVLETPESLSAVPDESFDAVVLWHVLEHVPDPVWMMRQARRVLRRGGELRMEVPNALALSATLLKPYWTAVAEPRHFFHFSPSTLVMVLRAAGWTDFRIRTIPKGNWWASALRHRTEVVRGRVPERPWFERRPVRSAFHACSRIAARFGLGESLLVSAARTA